MIKAAARPKRPVRGWRIARAALITLAALLVTAVAGFLIWANVGVMQASSAPLELVRSNPTVTITEFDDSVMLSPASEPSQLGLVFIPGAKVAAEAYLYKLSGLVEESGVTVVVTKPILNLAFFDQRPLTTFTGHASDVSTWYVGGHSLGGVRACQYAEQPEISGLVLFGSYCANDLSETGISALSLTGSEDGLSTPRKVSSANDLLPESTAFLEIQGANHAGFGDYGIQAGDGTAILSSAQMRAAITEQLVAFFD